MKKITLVGIVLFSFFLNSCDVLEQAQQVAMLTKCQFRLSSLQDTKLAGVNVQNKDSYADLSVIDATRIASAYATGSLPLSFVLNVEAKNPNTRAAGMSRLDWILLIDDLEVMNGITEKQITIPANGGTAVLPMELKIDLMKVLETKNVQSLANFGMNLAGVGNKPTRITLKAKPTVNIGSTPITYPSYIIIENEFSAN